MFARMKIIKDMSYFKNLILIFCVSGCGLTSSSGGGSSTPTTAEQKARYALAQETWGTSCINNWSADDYVIGIYNFTYSKLYSTATNTITYFPSTDATCGGTPSYRYRITSDYLSFGSEVSTSMGLTYQMNYRVSGVYIKPYDSNGIGMAADCGISSPVLNTEYDISGCTSADVPTVGTTGYTLMYVAEDYSTFTVEMLGTNFVSSGSRPSDFSGRQPDYMTYTY